MPTSFNSDTNSNSELAAGLRIEQRPGYWLGRFQCMASPCEVLAATSDEELARKIINAVATEAFRIEQTFSRYRDDNLIHRINTADGQAVQVDRELAELLDFAQTCWQISDGKFDITSGVLRRAWRFDGHSAIPDQKRIASLLPLVGWDKVSWSGSASSNPTLRMRAGMEIDLGGIGKEYAVDRAAGIALGIAASFAGSGDCGVLVNFGGDIRATGPHLDGSPWQVGIEAISEHGEPPPVISISRGAVATSGDARRYVIHRGKRYGHILDPHSGWPIAKAPRSVTVLDDTCTQAGLLSTLAMLKGRKAEKFLASQGVDFKVLR